VVVEERLNRLYGPACTSPLHEAVRRRAAERVDGALGKGIPPARILDERDALQELLSLPVARMLIVLLGDRILASRYAEAEAARVAVTLRADRDDGRLSEAAAALGVAVQAEEGVWRIALAAYLAAAPAEPGWKLVERTVDRGQIRLARDELVALVQESLERRLLAEMEAELKRPVPEEVRMALRPLVEALQPKLEAARETWNTGDFGPVQPGLFPPCVKELFERMKRAENIPHHGRFAFTTFLNTVGWGATEIMDYLAATPNFDREKSRYQIEHITGQKGVEAYMVPNCSTMQTNGVCPLEKRDGLCFKIKNPLSYYRAKIRFQRLDEEKAARVAGTSSPGSATTSSAPRTKEAKA